MFEGDGRLVDIYEVATRDRFQIEPTFVPTEAKIALIDELDRTGLRKIEGSPKQTRPRLHRGGGAALRRAVVRDASSRRRFPPWWRQ